MIGAVSFHYDELNDVHVAHPRWFIETEDDCRIWHKQYVDYFSKFPEKVDVIYMTDDFRIGPKIGSVWGKYRADLNNRFTRYSVRVHVEAKVAQYTNTSGVIYGASSEEAPDLSTAIAVIKAKRRHGGAAA
jgi:hypothetical protein